MNYKMIEDVIVASGFRPTRQQLFRQYVNILVTSLMTFVVSEVFKDMGSVAPFGSLADQSSDARPISIFPMLLLTLPMLIG